MNKIKQDKRNYRIHDDKNKSLIKHSIDEFGAGRSILIDAEDEIIGGNGVYEQWGDRPIKVVETDGSELIVVKRKDLKTNDPKRRMLAIMDNSTSDSSYFDKELLEMDFPEEELELMGIGINMDNQSENNKDEDEFNSQIEQRQIKGFIKTHVLISFPPEKMIYLQEYFQKIKDIDGIEYEQASN